MRNESRSAPDSGGLDPDEQRRHVRERYARIATDDDGSCCGGGADASGSDSADGCCDGDGDAASPERLGYTAEDVAAAAEAGDLSLGCGNPKALADLSPGERVLDLGSGAGFDCFLAANEVGPSGRVVGVDMTPAMVDRARETAAENDRSNVEFRLGEIENLPVADRSVDVVISNCVVNLSPDKQRVFEEAYRVLAPGGRVAISDVVLTAPVPTSMQDDPSSIAACVAGASTVDAVETMLAAAGFESVRVELDDDSEEFISEWDAERDLSEYVRSATIEADKPDDDGG